MHGLHLSGHLTTTTTLQLTMPEQTALSKRWKECRAKNTCMDCDKTLSK